MFEQFGLQQSLGAFPQPSPPVGLCTVKITGEDIGRPSPPNRRSSIIFFPRQKGSICLLSAVCIRAAVFSEWGRRKQHVGKKKALGKRRKLCYNSVGFHCRN